MEDTNKVERVKQILKEKVKTKEDETIKVDKTPKPLAPIEKAQAIQRAIDSKYRGRITSKLLPSLKKN